MVSAAADPVTKAVNRFQSERQNGRRYHRETIGACDPEHCFGDFLVSVAKSVCGDSAATGRLEKQYGVVRKAALAETSGTLGGYTVPTEFREDLMADVADIAVVRPRCLVTTQDSFTMLIPMPGAEFVEGVGVSPFYGGLQAVVTPENAAWTESEPQFEQVELTAGIIGGYVVGSNNWIADSRGLESWLRTLFARALAWYEDYFCLNNVPGGPQGIIGCPASISITRATANAFAIADAQNMLAAHHKLSSVEFSDWERAEGPSTTLWIMNRGASAQLTALTGWFPNGPFELYGMPIALTTKQPKFGSKGDIILADLAFYVLSDREQVGIDFSPHDPTPYLKNQSSWRVFERIGGAPLLGAPISLTDGSGNKVSPFIVLNSNPAT